MRFLRPLRVITALGLSLIWGAAHGQDITGSSITPAPGALDLSAPLASTVAPIVVLNQDRLLTRSLYGQRIQSEVEAAGSVLAAENRRIEGQLTVEELRLTERRALMSADEFRPLAEEFNSRVEGIRSAQEAKSRALQVQAEAAQARFYELAFPILVDLLRQRGAGVMMDSRAVLLSVEGVDITDEAIARVDAEVGQGGEAPLISIDGSAPAPTP